MTLLYDLSYSMALSSKLLDDLVVEKAKSQLQKIGKAALMSRKLEAVIAARTTNCSIDEIFNTYLI